MERISKCQKLQQVEKLEKEGLRQEGLGLLGHRSREAPRRQSDRGTCSDLAKQG